MSDDSRTTPDLSRLRGGARSASPGGASRLAPSPTLLRKRRRERGAAKQKDKQQFRREKRDVHGWIVLDKPVGMTSTQAVGAIKRLFSCKRAGHAGTLDPLASGCLPIALGEATKTVPFVMDGRKIYASPCAGARSATPTTPTAAWSRRATRARTAPRSRRCCRRYTGTISQVPPQYSAIKIDGERAYDLARDGETVELQARPVEIHRLELVNLPDADHRRIRGRMRQGHLCPLARPRYRPGARMSADISRRYGARRSAHSAKTT